MIKPAAEKATAPPPRTRQRAADRRAAIQVAAEEEFAVGGLHGTSTEAIARRAGVSQPYVFRLFGTKKALFLACVERGFDRVMALFQSAAEGAEDPFEAMGIAYFGLLRNRVALLSQMQAYAACGDPEVQAAVRARYGELYRWLHSVPGATEERVREFLAMGMLLNVVAAVDLPEVVGFDIDPSNPGST